MSEVRIRPKDRDTVLTALRAGVVPRSGLQHIQVGRHEEVKSIVKDLDHIGEGGSSFRLIIGEYGSGKTFFLSLIKLLALEKKLVTVHADLNPDRRLHATGGQSRSLYAELMRNISTRARPDGGAMQGIVEKFASEAESAAKQNGSTTESEISKRLTSLRELVGGYDFANVINLYWEGHKTDNVELMNSAVRWLRGEFSTKTDARHSLGVRTIIEDGNVYDHLKLMAIFVRLAGYGGLIVQLDEMVNLYKIGNSQARAANYEQILRILNDSMQGIAEGIGFVMGGTPEFLLDPRRGLFSYQALATRLEENSFAQKGLVDFNSPVIRLSNLTQEDMYVLLFRLRNLFANGNPENFLLPDEGIQAFMVHCSKRIGDSYFRTPRTSIRTFVDLLSVLEQNPDTSWTDLIESSEVVRDTIDESSELEDDDGLATIRI